MVETYWIFRFPYCNFSFEYLPQTSVAHYMCVWVEAYWFSAMSLSKWPPCGHIAFFGFRTRTLVWLWIAATLDFSWWRHQIETFSALLALCAGNSPVSGEFPSQRSVTRSFDVFFDLCLIKRLSKPSRHWRFETLSCPLWRHCNVLPGLDGMGTLLLTWFYFKPSMDKLRNGEVISSHTVLSMWLLIHAGIKVNPC